ncbi:MAG: hypothetical protein CSB48_03205 [Proteobacteria bacterium]|nr:MAG: hypothetical protein CSB48_03205 [Pseudomonadota bacterium]
MKFPGNQVHRLTLVLLLVLPVLCQPCVADSSLIAEYRLDGPDYSGATGVTDSSGHGLHGSAKGNARPGVAKVCLGAQLDGDGDYIEVADAPALDIADELTVMAWVNPDRLPVSGFNTILSRKGSFELHVNAAGRLLWKWYESGNSKAKTMTSGASLPVNAWSHVAIVYSRQAGTQKIYVNAVQQADRSEVSRPLETNDEPLLIGMHRDFRSQAFAGRIDEVKVFARALSGEEADFHRGVSRVCPDTGCTLGSFEIEQDDYGLACPSVRASVTVKAVCDDGTTIKDDYTGTVSFSATPTGTDSVTRFYLAATGGSPVSGYRFTGSERGEMIAYIYHNNENDVRVSVADTAAGVVSVSSSNTKFRTEGFAVTNPGNLVCGSSGTLTITAMGQNPTNSGCRVLTGFSGNKSLKAWFAAATDHGTGVDDAGVAPISLDGQALAVQNRPDVDNITLAFSKGKATPDVTYGAGAATYVANIKAINLEYSASPHDGVTLSVIKGSDSTDFVFYPLHAFTAIAAPDSSCPGGNASCSKFVPAGSRFDQETSLVCSDGDNTDLTDNPKAMQFKTAGTPLTLDYTPMAGTRCDDSPSGHNGACLGVDSVTISNASREISQSYAEVGVVRLEVNDYDYFGVTVPGYAQVAGRFYPDYFEVSVNEHGSFSDGCGSFTYIGQLDAALNGAIKYVTPPELQVTAFNSAGSQVMNYLDGFNRLSGNSFTVLPPTGDKNKKGEDGSTPMVVTSVIYSAVLTQNDPVPGVTSYQFSSLDNFVFEKDANSLVAPFTSHLEFSVTGLEDADGVTANNLPVAVQPVGGELRYGRWRMESEFGSELAGLTMTARAEYWDGSAFTINTADSCTDLTGLISSPQDPDNDLSDIAVGGGTTDFTFNGPLVSGEGGFAFTGSGENNQGQVNLEVDLSSLPWLKFDWHKTGVPESNPPVSASFGRYRGHDRVLYWKEVVQ